MSSRYIPASIRRELRQEANFGCAYCGTPIIQYHHIIPYREIEEHISKEMVALCPNCHAEADAGTITRDQLYQCKESPHNTDKVDYMFYFEPQPPILLLGSAAIEFGERGTISLIRIKGEDIISARYIEDRLHFDIHFFSKENELIASITDGEWWAKTDAVWDLKYKKTWLKMWHPDEEVGLKLEYNPESRNISFKGKFYYDGEELLITPSKMRYPVGGVEVHGGGYIMGGEDTDNCLLAEYESSISILHRTNVKRDRKGRIRAGLFNLSEGESGDSFIFQIPPSNE